MTDDTLFERISQHIKASGAISIAEYMHLCHSNIDKGYYATNDPIGKNGDFITAPEISQMFGEVIALWCVTQWEKLGKPNTITIAELGPGRATLMSDLLRTLRKFPKLGNITEIAMVETSPKLARHQREALSMFDHETNWYSSVEKLKPQPTIFIANEFLDAIPFRQFVKKEALWLENCISLGDKNEFQFSLSNTQLDVQFLPKAHENEPQGSVFEHAPARSAITQLIGEHIVQYGGAGILIDYGHAKSGFGDTFQAVKNHAPVSPLETPGECDLTCHVDFEAISNAVKMAGAQVQRLQSQSEFLREYGLLERAGQLGSGKSLEVQTRITRDVERLIGENEMGQLFKALQFSYPVS